MKTYIFLTRPSQTHSSFAWISLIRRSHKVQGPHRGHPSVPNKLDAAMQKDALLSVPGPASKSSLRKSLGARAKPALEPALRVTFKTTPARISIAIPIALQRSSPPAPALGHDSW